MKYLLLLLILASLSVNSWSCATHEKICNLAGYPELNCCLADNMTNPNHVPPIYHACRNNKPDCNARIYAEKYLNESRPEIAAHLIADAMCPAHWYSLDYSSCHGKFEGKVNDYVKEDWAVWSYNISCVTKDSEVRVTLEANETYIQEVAIAVRDYLGAKTEPTTQPTPPPVQEQGVLEQITSGLSGLWSKIIAFFESFRF